MDRDRFVVILDVRHYSPDELTVKANDDYIEVHAKRDEEGQVTKQVFKLTKLNIKFIVVLCYKKQG